MDGTNMTRKCKNCGDKIVEGQAYCDSFKCVLENKEYEDFIEENGPHCHGCFEKARIQELVEPRPFINGVPTCENCSDSSFVIPVRSRDGTILGWLCQVCEWQNEASESERDSVVSPNHEGLTQ
jgi:hypothetical protein